MIKHYNRLDELLGIVNALPRVLDNFPALKEAIAKDAAENGYSCLVDELCRLNSQVRIAKEQAAKVSSKEWWLLDPTFQKIAQRLR